jgi:glycosyltransferase involved in cell wall biosynthesis
MTSSLRERLYAWGRKSLPVGWRRALRRTIAVEKLFGIEKPPPEARLRPLSVEQTVGSGLDLIFLPVIPWFYRWQRPQQLASALARRGRRVFYGTLGGLGEPLKPVAAETGVILLPIPGIWWEDPPDRRLRGRALREAEEAFARYRERFGLDRAATVAQTPYWEPLAVALRRRFGWRIVFDCLDEYAAFSTNREAVLQESGERLAASADLVVATARPLLEKAARRNANARLLPNACDYDFFAGVGPRAASAALRIWYFGALEEWFDTDLLIELARRRPDWTFDLVGEPDPRVRAELAGLPNVVLRGERPYRELPAYLETFDVVAVPLRLTPLTQAVDPVKFYEAAAAGRPVVATPMAPLEPLAARGLVRLAATAADFEREIEAAAVEAPRAAPILRAFARENTWGARAKDLETMVEELFSPRS